MPTFPHGTQPPKPERHSPWGSGLARNTLLIFPGFFPWGAFPGKALASRPGGGEDEADLNLRSRHSWLKAVSAAHQKCPVLLDNVVGLAASPGAAMKGVGGRRRGVGCTRQLWGCRTGDAGAVWGQKCSYLLWSHPLGLWLPHCAGTSRVLGHDVGQGRCAPQKVLGFRAAFILPVPSAGEADTHAASLGSRWRGGMGKSLGKGNILPQECPGALQAAQQPQGVLSSCGEAVGLQEGVMPLCNPCMGGLFFFSRLADPLSAPASPSLSVTLGQSVLCGMCPPSHGSHGGTQSPGRGTERVGKRFGKGSLKGSVQGRGQCSSS